MKISDKLAIAVGLVAGGAILFILFFSNTKQVTIDSKHFECVQAEPFGLETRCTMYARVKGAR